MYERCQTCKIGGNNTNLNCLICQSNYPFPIKKNNYINCYEACNHYYYFDNNNSFHCTFNSKCPAAFPKLNNTTKECTKKH